MKHIRWIALVLVLMTAGIVFLTKPREVPIHYDSYFAAINESLRSSGISRPQILIDMDRLDANIETLKKKIEPPVHYRIVEKSLPSFDLQRYVMEKTGTRRFMVFHGPFIWPLLREMGPDVDALLGKPMPIAEVRNFYTALPAGEKSKIFRQVQWLVDTPERAKEYARFGDEERLTLRVTVEIDVGLRRGGVPDPGEIGPLLKIIEGENSLSFTGFMGYDGHVPHVPFYLPGGRHAAMKGELKTVMERYAAFIEAGRSAAPVLFSRKELTFNGGGSKTYSLYTPLFPVNDISAGSCLLKPADFDTSTLTEHQPAVFIAAPVLKELPAFSVPFLETFYTIIALWNPNAARGFYLYGGGWSKTVTAPEGLTINTLTASAPNENLLPNQSLVNGSRSGSLRVGDFVFFRPAQGDALSQFEKIVLIRGGRIVGSFRPLPVRF